MDSYSPTLQSANTDSVPADDSPRPRSDSTKRQVLVGKCTGKKKKKEKKAERSPVRTLKVRDKVLLKHREKTVRLPLMPKEMHLGTGHSATVGLCIYTYLISLSASTLHLIYKCRLFQYSVFNLIYLYAVFCLLLSFLISSPICLKTVDNWFFFFLTAESLKHSGTKRPLFLLGEGYCGGFAVDLLPKFVC